MKRVKRFPLVGILICFIALLAVCAGFFGGKTANADADREIPRPTDSTYIDAYDITIDVKTDRSMTIVEYITVYYFYNTGFLRDIPVNAGEVVKNIKVNEMIGDEPTSVYYSVYGESDDSSNKFVTVDIGDYSTKYKEFHTYRIEYDFCLTKAQEGSDMLALTPVGAGWSCSIYDISVKLTLPAGYVLDEKTFCSTVDSFDKEEIIPFTEGVADDGKTTLSAEIPFIRAYTQVRFDVHFEDGVLSTYFDFTPYIFVIVGGVLILVLIGFKFLFFNKNTITPVINFEAPEKMDPLMMGKLIDNKVDASDITSLIYYFADKGWLKIAIDEKDTEPTLIRTVKTLPNDCADYEKLTFARLFSGQDSVTPGQLKYKFYTAVPQITSMVNAKTKKLYSGKSLIASGVFAIMAALLLAIAPISLALSQISILYSLTSLLPMLIVIIPSFVVFALSLAIKYNELKYSVKKKILCYLGLVLLCAVFTTVYALLVPSYIIALPARILLCAVCCAAVIISVILTSRTENYVKKLNDIIGFKNFIQLTEKAQLEMMLEENPQLYYHVLPYAQVLGVSDIWEEKFKNITVQPPHWCTATNIATFYVMNRMISRSFATMRSNMVSRPSSSGSSGFSGGGHSFGGHHGGGHGGGGGRFR